MKKLPTIILTLSFSGLIWGAFLVPSVFAQSSGDFVFLQQGDLSSQSSLPLSAGVTYYTDNAEIGSGYQGTTTGAEVAAFINPGPSDDTYGTITLTLSAYPTSGYATSDGQCTYETQGGTGVVLPVNPPFIDLVLTSCSGDMAGGVLNPSDFLQVNYETYSASYFPVPLVVFGSAATSSPLWVITQQQIPDLWFPQFAVVGSGFQITPTASSSGLFLSGALTYCADSFASSTAPAIISDFGVGLCDVGGYLFVPTPLSIQQFGDTLPLLEAKIPFSYAYGAVSLYQSLQASSTENLPSLSIPFIDAAFSTLLRGMVPSSIPILSTTTISMYYPSPIRETFLFLGTCAIWVEALFVCYRRIVPHKVL